VFAAVFANLAAKGILCCKKRKAANKGIPESELNFYGSQFLRQ